MGGSVDWALKDVLLLDIFFDNVKLLLGALVNITFEMPGNEIVGALLVRLNSKFSQQVSTLSDQALALTSSIGCANRSCGPPKPGRLL